MPRSKGDAADAPREPRSGRLRNLDSAGVDIVAKQILESPTALISTVDEIVAEYSDACAQTMELIGCIPAETLRQSGTIPWYGAEYSLDDLIVYMYYGHKREHAAQIAAFRDRMKQL